MKKIIILITGFLFVQSCKKEDLSQFNKGNADRNGVAWNAIGRTSEVSTPKGKIAILLGITSLEGIETEILTMENIPKKIGIYTVGNLFENRPANLPYTTFFTHEQDGDVTSGIFLPVEGGAPNTVEITSISNSKNVYEGKFNLTFYKQNANPVTCKLPDTLRFTNGYFKLATKD